jgi:hypothetical protein
MSTSIDTTIATALLGYLAAQIGAGPSARAFCRLEGCREATYRDLLDKLDAQGSQIAGRTLVARSIVAIEGHPEVAMEPERSATWYRNHLPPGQTLLLILNRRTSDAQSLKDLYGVSEQTLTRDGIEKLIEVSFEEYQLDASQQRILVDFVRRLRRLRLEPQLRDLAEFLRQVDMIMHERPGTQLNDAIADALPAINLFRCRELAAHLNTPRGDKLLRALKQAAQIGAEVLDTSMRSDLLSRLARATLADDSAFGGLNAADKADLLRRFIDGLLGDSRPELLQVLSIDWHEVQQVISSRVRVIKPERYKKLAERLVAAAEQIGFVKNDDLIEVVASLQDGREPDGETVERLLGEVGDSLGKALRNDLRRMVRPRTRRGADFLVGLVSVAVDLLYPRQNELGADAQLRVALAPATLERQDRLHEAADVFQAIYGGLEQALPALDWQIEPLWEIAATSTEQGEENESEERERVAREEIAFRVAVVGADGGELATAELIWQYRSDSPAAATARTLAAEGAQLQSDDLGPLFAGPAPSLRVPIYNSCQTLDEIGDLDLRYPLGSLGAWYEQPSDLRADLESQLKPSARPQAWASFEAALTALEQSWASFVEASRNGLLGADVGPLLGAYEALLVTAIGSLQTGNEVGASYRLINQAWVIGPPKFTTWAIVPLLHPLKLLWWRERARYFNILLARLLDPSVTRWNVTSWFGSYIGSWLEWLSSRAEPALIVDVKRFQQELGATYGSSSFPPVLALPPGPGRPAARFLPIEEAEGYELYFHETASAEAFGLDTDLLAEDENELAALRAVEGIVAVVQDYIETYPFVRDGVEIFLFECRNGALPGMLIEQLTKAGERRGWSVRLTVVVHTRERGAPLFRRVSKWVAGGHPRAERQGQAYFPPITVKVLECEPEDLFSQQEDTDIVVLADVLAERGQHVYSELELLDGDDPPAEGYLPTYRARQEPFQHGEQYRRILLSAPQQPTVARLFLLAQHAALEKQKRPLQKGYEAQFYRELTLEEWKFEIERLHNRFNWVVCYDTSIDRFLLEAAFPDKVQVIRYSLGLGAKRQHNLTVSSSGRAQTIVIRRLAARLGQMFPQAPTAFCNDVAMRLVTEAKHVSGDIVLRAAGPGAFLNELIGMVAAKFEVEQRYRAQHLDALTTWILLDDFEHWFGGGKFPDLLFVAIHRGDAGDLALYLQILETKCVGQISFDSEAADAEEQVRRGVGRLAQAFAPGNAHLDALFWYDQLYRAVAGNLAVEPEQQEIWELFRDQLHTGAFQLDLSGHTWIFCYDGQAEVSAGPAERPFSSKAPDAPEIPLRAHHYGRNELAELLSALIRARGGPDAPPEVWKQPPAPPQQVVERTSAEPVVITAPLQTEPAPPCVETPATATTPLALAPEEGSAPAPSSLSASEQQWLADKARDLERALRQRGVQLLPIDPTQADVGPSIVRFKLRLRPNESLRKIQGVAEDLARDLALASTPIIANVQRSNFVGVDIPREQAQMVELRPLLERLGTPGPAELPIVIGVTPDGALVVEDLSEFPHLLVAGATNSGKSVFLRSMLLSLMTQYPAGKLELLIVDPKRTDFTFFNSVPYLRGDKVIVERNEARDALLELVRAEMPRRQNLIANRSLKVKLFNQRYPDEALPPIVALIDEYALLVSMMDKKEREAFEQDLMILAAAARSVGIHLVLATQRPSADIVTSTLKANLDARIAFRVASNTNSRVVLDTTGAENLLGRGDMLFRRPSGEIVRLQAPFMGEEQMQAYLATLVEGATR